MESKECILTTKVYHFFVHLYLLLSGVCFNAVLIVGCNIDGGG